ncbi:MAG TPA: TIGR03435 family protein [Bryobacteraceae bacterium]|jgi:uncharacterized protein (TIGR03435 family)|nr:TIGR03435 family protein [Bryobacteraceae bacterium]
MTAIAVGLCPIVFIAARAFAQDSQAVSTFQVADVHSSVPATSSAMQGGILRGGRIEIRRATILDLIKIAYAVDPHVVFGGPSWLDWNRFDVIAKSPVDTPSATVKLMLRALLADRFKLVVHRDARPVPGFLLTVGKSKAKLKEADGSGETGCSAHLQRGEGTVPSWVAACRNMTMEAFAEALRGLDSRYLTSPVADQTGLGGAWDFDLKWTDKRGLPYADADGVTLFDAVDRQLGLKLATGKVPMPVLVVDHVNQKPTPNSPEVAALLPPLPAPEFEVASIRPSRPGEPPGKRLIQPGGRVEMRGVPLFLLIMQAWNLNIDPEEGLPGKPEWLKPFEPAFDLVAKAPAVAVSDGAVTSEDDFNLMLRALLADRFRMAAHYEYRPMDAYTLVAAKPKLKRADPSIRAGCKTERAPLNGQTQVAATCRNMTLAHFAEQLQTIAPNYLRYPALSDSGIEGGWDFAFTFSSIPPKMLAASGSQGGPRGGAASTGRDMPSGDPIGGISLFDAMEKQLGLKLEKHKRPEPVFVIDHLEERPTDN